MFSGIVTGLGEILEVDEKSDGLRRLVIACNYDPEFDRGRRVNRLFRNLPYRR